MDGGFNFPIFRTKREDIKKKFNLNDPAERQEYFEFKAGREIAKLKEYFSRGGTFVAYLLGKKNSGKGTYAKLFMEVVGAEHVGHMSIGDIIRDVEEGLSTRAGKEAFLEFVRKNYRGFHSTEETLDFFKKRSTAVLLPSELVVMLIKYEISKRPRQAIFVDGFPRAMDQVTYSLYLRELIGYRDDPDFFVFISLPNAVIDERIKYRVICPICKTPRSMRLLPTNNVGFDEAQKAFYLMCDGPSCKSARMVSKEGDELGVKPLEERLATDGKIMAQLLKLHGVPKVYLRNAVPVAKAKEYADDYEITPAYEYEYDAAEKRVKVTERPWMVKDDEGELSYSLLPPAVCLALIKQTVAVLGLE